MFALYVCGEPRKVNEKTQINKITKPEEMLCCVVLSFGLSSVSKCESRCVLSVRYQRGNLDLLKWTGVLLMWLNLEISLRSCKTEILHRNSYLNLEKR